MSNRATASSLLAATVTCLTVLVATPLHAQDAPNHCEISTAVTRVVQSGNLTTVWAFDLTVTSTAGADGRSNRANAAASMLMGPGDSYDPDGSLEAITATTGVFANNIVILRVATDDEDETPWTDEARDITLGNTNVFCPGSASLELETTTAGMDTYEGQTATHRYSVSIVALLRD